MFIRQMRKYLWIWFGFVNFKPYFTTNYVLGLSPGYWVLTTLKRFVTDLQELCDRRINDHQRSLNEMHHSVLHRNVSLDNVCKDNAGCMLWISENGIRFNVGWKIDKKMLINNILNGILKPSSLTSDHRVKH